LVGGLYSPSHLSVVGYLQDFIKACMPPTILLHPGREAAVGPRLLIRREIPAYFADNLYIQRSLHYPPPVDALGCHYSSAESMVILIIGPITSMAGVSRYSSILSPHARFICYVDVSPSDSNCSKEPYLQTGPAVKAFALI